MLLFDGSIPCQRSVTQKNRHFDVTPDFQPRLRLVSEILFFFFHKAVERRTVVRAPRLVPANLELCLDVAARHGVPPNRRTL
jgi:hypothetical protein